MRKEKQKGMKGHMWARIMSEGGGERGGGGRWLQALIVTKPYHSQALTSQAHPHTATTPRRLGHPADISWTSAATWQNGRLPTKLNDEAHHLGAAGRSNLVIPTTHRLCSTRWRPSPQSHRETESARRKTQQAREHRRNIGPFQRSRHQLLHKYHPRRCFFLGTDW